MKEGIDVQKTRRRIEDVLRKSDPKTIIKVANLIGVEIAKYFLWEEIPKSEIFLADLWEELEGKKSQSARMSPDDRGLTPQGRKILKFLPVRFATYSVRHDDKGALRPDFLTLDAAEEFEKKVNKKWEEDCIKKEFFVREVPRNVIQMRTFLRAVRQYHLSSIEPDEEKVFRKLEKVLFRKI